MKTYLESHQHLGEDGKNLVEIFHPPIIPVFLLKAKILFLEVQMIQKWSF